ncbi:hypothetical protein ACHAWF_012096, partial [Thalassiosira exigua]
RGYDPLDTIFDGGHLGRMGRAIGGWGREEDKEDARTRIDDSMGRGRLKVTSAGLIIGTMAFVAHELPQCLSWDNGILPIDSTNNQQSDGISDWNFKLFWHIFMRMLWAASFALTAPSIDGLALDHLDCIEDASQIDFGIERMYGAVWWGVGSLIAGMGIDRCGFVFLHVMAVVCALATFAELGYIFGVCEETRLVRLSWGA